MRCRRSGPPRPGRRVPGRRRRRRRPPRRGQEVRRRRCVDRDERGDANEHQGLRVERRSRDRAGGHVREQIEDGGVSRLCHGSPLSRGAADGAPGSVFSHSIHDEKHMVDQTLEWFPSVAGSSLTSALPVVVTAKPVTGLGESTSPTLEFTQVNRAQRARVGRPAPASRGAVRRTRTTEEAKGDNGGPRYVEAG